MTVTAPPVASARTRPRAAAPTPPAAPRPVPAWVLPAIVVGGAALRLWRTTTNGLTFDESYTAVVGRKSLPDILSYLRRTDLHPPLDYVLRAPLARAGASDVVMRLPSVAFSCGALALFAWWMRTRGWFGVIATALMGASTFQVFYGGEARMYALLQLVGVSAVVIGERWLRAPTSWHALAIAGLVLVAVFDHVSGFLFAAGLFALAGTRRDHEAWRWRAAVCAGAALWVPLWGPAFLEQRHLQWSSWMPRTSVSAFADTVSRQVVFADGVELVVLAAVVVGGIVLVRRDRLLGRLWLACGAVPFALAAFFGLFEGLLFDRTLTVASWAVPVALASLLASIIDCRRPLGTVAAVCVVLFVFLDATTFLTLKTWDYDLSVERLERVARPGDVIAVRPASYGALVDWRIGVRGDRPTRAARIAIPDTDALRVLGGTATDRIWLLTPVGSPTRFAGYARCAAPWTDGVTTVGCLEARRG